MPLLKNEWVELGEARPVAAVKGGRSPAERTLDGAGGTPLIQLDPLESQKRLIHEIQRRGKSM
jgi:hypothetical protein